MSKYLSGVFSTTYAVGGAPPANPTVPIETIVIGNQNLQGVMQITADTKTSLQSTYNENGIYIGLDTTNAYAGMKLLAPTATGNGAYIDFTTLNTSYYGRILYDNNINSMNFYTNAASTAAMTIVSTGSIVINNTLAINSTLNMNSNKILNVATPTLTTDASNKGYIDSIIQGLNTKQAARAATTVAGTLATSFMNGSVIDGVTLVTGDRILIKNQTTGTENGIYIVQASGAPLRSSDFAVGTSQAGSFLYVKQGTINADILFVCNNDPPNDIVGTNSLTFLGGSSMTAGTGLTLTGNVLSVNNTLPNVTQVGTLTSLSISSASAGPVLSVISNATSTQNLASFFTPNILAGNYCYLYFGQGNGINNSVVLRFNYVANNSTSNYFSITSPDVGELFNFKYTGQFSINTIATSGTPSLIGSYFTVGSNAFTDSNTVTSGTLASMAFSSFAQPTLAATNTSVTTTNAATVYIAGGPLAGTNESITNSYGLWNIGQTRFDNFVTINNGTTPALLVNSSITITAVLLRLYASSLGTGQDCEIQFGVSSNAYNCGIMQFNYVANGSNTNYIGLGFWNYNNLFQLYGTGVVKLIGNTDATSTTTGTFISAGGISSQANIISTNILQAQSGSIGWEDQKLTTLNTASTTNSAGYIYSQNNYIQFTALVNSQANSIYWKQNPGHSWYCKFDLYYGNGNGADGMSLAVYQTAIPADSYTNNGGYIVTFSEWNNNIVIAVPGQTTTSSGGTIINSTYNTLVPTATWATATVTFNMGLLRVYINNVLIGSVEIQDVSSVTDSINSYIAISGHNGGANNYHRVRNVEFYKGCPNSTFVNNMYGSNLTLVNSSAGPLLSVVSNATTNANCIAYFTTPNLIAGNYCYLCFGQANTINNAVTLKFTYIANNSTSNYFSIVSPAIGELFNFKFNGQFSIVTLATSGTPSLIGAYFTVGGSIFTDSNTVASGTLTSMSFNSFAQPTLAATNSSVTTTNAATVYIAGGPLSSTNETITNSYGLWNVGQTRLDSTLTCSASNSTTFGTPFTFTNTYAGVQPWTAGFFASNLIAGGTNNSTGIIVGQSASNYNTGQLTFIYAGSGSTSNCVTLGIYGTSAQISVSGTGQVQIPTNIASTSSTTGSFTTPGGISTSNTTDATSSTNGGSGTFNGGLAVGKTAYLGALNINSNAFGDGVVRISPQTNGTQSGYAMYQNTNQGGISWVIGHSIGSSGSGNFGLWNSVSGTCMTIGNANGTINTTNTGVGGYITTITTLAPNNTPANNVTNIMFGVSATKYNTGYIGLNYVGAGSASNYVTIGLNNADKLLNIYPTGQVQMTGTIDATSTTTGTCVIAGGISSQANIISKNILQAQNTCIGWEDQKLANLNTATATGGAGYVYAQNNCIQLTANVNSQHNTIYWQQNPGHSWYCRFDLYYGGGNGADGIALAVYQTIGSGDAYTNNGGYVVTFSEYNNNIVITAPGQSYSNGTVISSAYTSLVPASTWATATITFVMGLLRVYINTALIGSIEIQDASSVTDAINSYIYIAAHTGGLNNYHSVRNIEFYKGCPNTALIYNLVATVATINTPSGTIPLSLTTASTGSTTMLRYLAGSMTTGNECEMNFGVNLSSYNVGTMQFNYVGSGSTGNYIGLGFWAANNLFQLYGTGVMKLTGSTDATNATTGTGVIAGGLGIAKSAYIGGQLHVNYSGFGGGGGALKISPQSNGGESSLMFAQNTADSGGNWYIGHSVGNSGSGNFAIYNSVISACMTIIGSNGTIYAHNALHINNNSGGGPYQQLKLSPSANGGESSIGFFQNTNEGGANWVLGHNTGGSGSGNFGFWSSLANPNLVMSINGSSGAIYMTGALHVNAQSVGGGSQQLKISPSSNGGECSIGFYNNTAEGGNTWSIGLGTGMAGAGNLGFYSSAANPSTLMTMNGTSGAIYIGSSFHVNWGGMGGANQQLKVSPSSNGGEASMVFYQNTAEGGSFWTIGHAVAGSGSGSFGISNSSGPMCTMNLSSGLTTFIGSVATNQALHVNSGGGGGANGQLKISPSTNGGEASIDFYNNTAEGGNYWVIGQNTGNAGAGNLGIYNTANGSTVMSMNSSNNSSVFNGTVTFNGGYTMPSNTGCFFGPNSELYENGAGHYMVIANSTYGVQIMGSLSKSSGTFDIPHPDPVKKKKKYRLRHSFVESNTRGDNIYRYIVKTKDRKAEIQLPDYFKYLNENPQVFVSGVGIVGACGGYVDSELEKIYIEVSKDGTYNVLVIGTRKDELAVKNFDPKGIEYIDEDGIFE